MNILLYVLAGIGSASLAAQHLFRRNSHPATIAFSLLCLIVALTFSGFALHLWIKPSFSLPVHQFPVCFLPLSFAWLIHRWDGPVRPRLRKELFAGGCICILVLVVTGALGLTTNWSDPTSFIVGCFFLIGNGATLWWWKIHLKIKADHPRDHYLWWLTAVAMGVLILEGAIRLLNPDYTFEFLAGLTAGQRSSHLQGWLPPIGSALALLVLYVFHLNVKHARLISIAELLARLASRSVKALMLTSLIAAVLWIGSGSALHTAFQLFLCCLIFFTLVDGIHRPIDQVLHLMINRQGVLLRSIFSSLEGDITRLVERQQLNDTLLKRLYESGRFDEASLYLWDSSSEMYQLRKHFGSQSPIPSVGKGPFVEGFKLGEIHRIDVLKRRSIRNEDAAIVLRTLEQMNAELCIPIWTNNSIVGWVNLSSPDRGFSSEEIELLMQLADRITVASETIQSVEQLKEQHRLAALGTMSAGLAHEIRNPLAAIHGAAEYLQKTETPDQQPMFLQLILDESMRLNSVVAQFLDYARPLSPNEIPIDLNLLISKAQTSINVAQPSAACRWSFELSDNLPMLMCDPHLLHQVMINLFQNAIEANEDEPQIRVRTYLSRVLVPPHIGQPAISIDVEDNGPPMDPEVRAQLFIPFFTTKQNGNGLGLAIVARIIETHHGNINVTTHRGGGTRFTVQLPILQQV